MQRKAYIVSIMFETNVYQGEIKTDDSESLELKFFAIDDLPTNLNKLFIPVARDLMRRKLGD